MAAGLVAFGAGLVIASLIPASDKEARAAAQVVDTAKEKGQPLVEDAKAAAQDVAHSVAESARDAAATVKDTATESAERVRDEGQVERGRGARPVGQVTRTGAAARPRRGGPPLSCPCPAKPLGPDPWRFTPEERGPCRSLRTGFTL